MRMKQKLLGLLVALCMLAVCIPVAAAENSAPEGLWTDYAADTFAGGTGTAEDPYQIATAEQLAKLAKEVNAGGESTHRGEYFILTADIDLAAHVWTPLGYESYSSGGGSMQAFSGYFNGNGKTVTGLYVDERGRNRSAGLFGCVVSYSEEPVIQNLTVTGAQVYAGDGTDSNEMQYGAGVLIGRITINGSSSAQYTVVKDCAVSGMVDSAMYAGGLVGDANYVHFENCQADVQVKGISTSGGFVANAFESAFEDCVARGDVESQGWSTGGFAGILFCGTKVTHCAAFGDVEASDWNLGGFVGYAEEDISIQNSIAMGTVTSHVTQWDPKAGGFVGTAVGMVKLEKCHAAGEVTAQGTGSVGGFIAVGDDASASGCSYSKEKNADLPAVGQEASGTYEIGALNTAAVLANICADYYGGHDMENVPAVDPTCTADGTGAGSECKRCGYREGFAVIPAQGHDYQNGVCTRCQEACPHTGGTATCTQQAVCDVCGMPYGERNPDHHARLTAVSAKAATKDAEGNIAYWYCADCGKYYADAAATREITKADTVIQKTVEDQGKDAGASKPADKAQTPKTGDEGNLALWSALLLCSGGIAIGGAVLIGKKKHVDR